MTGSMLLAIAALLAVLVFLSWAFSYVAGAERREARAIMLGLLWASFAPAVVLSIALERDVEGMLAVLLISWIFSTVVTFFVGLPAFLLLRRFLAPGTWWISTGVGFAIGLVANWAVIGSHGSLDGVVAMGFAGAIAALGFWLIWRAGIAPRRAEERRGCC